jgi:hypothetical protein
MGQIMKFLKPQSVYNGEKKSVLRHKHLVIFFGYFGLSIVKQINYFGWSITHEGTIYVRNSKLSYHL